MSQNETNNPLGPENNQTQLEQAVNEAMEPVVKEMADLAISGAEEEMRTQVPTAAVEEAESITRDYAPTTAVEEGEDIARTQDLHEHFMKEMDVARGGVDSLAAVGRATPDIIVKRANIQLAYGVDPNVVAAGGVKTQSLGETQAQRSVKPGYGVDENFG